MNSSHGEKNIEETNQKGLEIMTRVNTYKSECLTMLIAIADCESETYTKSRCNNN